MSELVLLHHNEPMTTSLAIADGVGMAHNSVLVLIKKHTESLSQFGPCEFQIEMVKRPQGGGANREVFFLNEQQATLLITFMRNSEIVVKFKVALVKAFFDLRDRFAVPPAPTFERASDPGKLYPIHEADKIVASDRVFRATLRASRAAGMTSDAAYEVARKVAHGVSGVDLAGLIKEIDRELNPPLKDAAEGATRFFAAAEAGEIEQVCLDDIDHDWLMTCYRAWCKAHYYHVGSLDWHMKNRWYRRWKAEKEKAA
jgi:hypothetical protein